MGKFWQRNYYEHIIRGDASYQRISEYITTRTAFCFGLGVSTHTMTRLENPKAQDS